MTDEHHTELNVHDELQPGSRHDEEKMKLLSGQNNSKYPRSVFFIIGNEFCERFSFYGMRAILIIYLTDRLKFSDSKATAIYHAFVCMAYFMPLFGAMLADGMLGKYKTILYVSIVYLAGNIIMTFTAIPPPEAIGPMIGLIVIAVGTGGIKPCVSAFAGDQFSANQEKERNQFFSMFYFSINLGSFLSMLVTPAVRANTYCFGSKCYMLAFGIPALLMIVALVLFVFGRQYYLIVSPSGSVIQKMMACVSHALARKRQLSGTVKDHWLDYADDKYDESFRNEVRSVLRLLLMFVPMPMFYALFDQQGSSWTLQCSKMDLRISEHWYLLPDQMQSFNSLLILVFIPLFEFIIYPLAEKDQVNSRPLRRMVIGMSLAAGSFIIAGILQIAIEWTFRNTPSPGASTSRLQVINASPCAVDISGHLGRVRLDVSQFSNATIKQNGRHRISVSTSCVKYAGRTPLQSVVELRPWKAYFYLIADHGGSVDGMLMEYPSEKSKLGGSFVCVVVVETLVNDTFAITLEKNEYTSLRLKISAKKISGCRHVEPGRYSLRVANNESDSKKLDKTTYFGTGAVHVLVFRPTGVAHRRDTQLLFNDYILVPHNVVSVLYQIPQYVVLTVGEILFSITGLAFAYSQAPESMKSVIQAAWLLTTAFGNLVDVIVTGVHFLSQVAEFFLFAILMTIATVVFAFMSYYYEYTQVDDHRPPSDDDLSSATKRGK